MTFVAGSTIASSRPSWMATSPPPAFLTSPLLSRVAMSLSVSAPNSPVLLSLSRLWRCPCQDSDLASPQPTSLRPPHTAQLELHRVLMGRTRGRVQRGRRTASDVPFHSRCTTSSGNGSFLLAADFATFPVVCLVNPAVFRCRRLFRLV